MYKIKEYRISIIKTSHLHTIKKIKIKQQPFVDSGFEGFFAIAI
jgi:hypothetical protein